MFSQEVKERAMIACERHCCLCHRPCGVKMECNHIIPEANGGPNTDENCIPLCFDCHADVGHYNTKHPKGTKFGSGELRARRDSWYASVKNGFIRQAPDKLLSLDVELFKKVYAVLGGNSMYHFRDHDYGSRYLRQFDERLTDFAHMATLPEAQFFNPEMQTAFINLEHAIETYLVKGRTLVSWETDGSAGIPPEWLQRGEAGEKRFWDAVATMNNNAQQVWSNFSEFVKTGRRSLAADPTI